MNALDQQYADRNQQRFDAVAHTEPTDLDEMRAAIAEHLAYLDAAAKDCTDMIKRSMPGLAIAMEQAAAVYAEVAAELRNTLRMEQP
jgi:phage terminase Nu1 subunit (DNA packaging protein)